MQCSKSHTATILIIFCISDESSYALSEYQNKQVLITNGHMYKKYRGRAYQSFWLCMMTKCNGQVVLSHRKGGSLKIVCNHSLDCLANPESHQNMLIVKN